MIKNWFSFNEKKKLRKESAVCIIKYNNKILLLERCDNDRISGWCLPGGKIDKGETTLQGVIRETFEETGLKIFSPKLLGQSTSVSGRIVHVYECKINSNKVTISKEHKNYKWVKIKDIDVTLAGNTMEFINMSKK